MTIAEPMTVLTDYLLAALVTWFALRLWGEAGRTGQRSVRWWSLAFFASAAAALLGGSAHGFAPHLGEIGRLVLWKATVLAVGLASLCLLAATLFAVFRPKVRSWLLGAALLKFGLYALWMASHDAFIYVIYDYGLAMLLVLLMQLHALITRRAAGARWVIDGILVSFAAAALQASGLEFHRHFNHNDLYHLVQMGAFFLLYRGGLLLRDR